MPGDIKVWMKDIISTMCSALTPHVFFDKIIFMYVITNGTTDSVVAKVLELKDDVAYSSYTIHIEVLGNGRYTIFVFDIPQDRFSMLMTPSSEYSMCSKSIP